MTYCKMAWARNRSASDGETCGELEIYHHGCTALIVCLSGYSGSGTDTIWNKDKIFKKSLANPWYISTGKREFLFGRLHSGNSAHHM